MDFIDFGGFFLSYKIQLIHRHFSGTTVSFLAVFSVFEFLHNLNILIDNINNERNLKTTDETAEIKKPFMIEHYKKRIEWLKEDHIDVRPEVWNFIQNAKNISDEEKKYMEKQAADETLRILTEPTNILRFIEKAIDGNYNLK